MKKKKKLSIVFPVYENELNLPFLLDEIVEFEKKIDSYDLELIFIDDGSKDNSFREMKKLKQILKVNIKLIQFTQNFGQAAALQCGWTVASGDFIGNISSDQQDPLLIFKRMLNYLEDDYDIVIAARKKREDGIISDFLSNFFFYFINKFVIKDYPIMGSDLMLFTKEVKDYILKRDERGNSEVSILIRSGFKYNIIYYDRIKRKYGKNQTSLFKKITAMIDIIFSNSYIPIRLVSIMGFLLGFFGLLYGVYVIYQKFIDFNSTDNLGWASTISILSIFSGFILISLGIIGEYFWRIFENIKKPNIYSIKERTFD